MFEFKRIQVERMLLKKVKKIDNMSKIIYLYTEKGSEMGAIGGMCELSIDYSTTLCFFENDREAFSF